MTKLSFFLVIISLMVLISCKSNTKKVRKPVSHIEILPSGNQLTSGEKATIKIQSTAKNSSIKIVNLYINNQLVYTSNNNKILFSVNTDTLLTGNHAIKVESENVNGVKGINYHSIHILSDIIPKNKTYSIIKKYKHNPTYFTQGLEFKGDTLFESTGDYGTTYIYSYNPENEEIYRNIKSNDEIFGEGMTILNNKIYQLTYKMQQGFVYDLNTFKKINKFKFSSKEGWGLTNDGQHLIMSDGTSKLTFIDPTNFKVVKDLNVCDNISNVTNLNELEFVNGVIYANLYTQQRIAKIDAHTGKVLAYINMQGLMKDAYDGKSRIDVLNGIAYNKEKATFFVTGKLWPKIYEVKFTD